MKRNGFFVEVGGNHPTKINNSYLFEKNGWKGIAFEPIKCLNELWKEKRQTECILAAVGDSDGEVDFEEDIDDTLSGVVGKKDRKTISTYKVTQRSLSSVFLERNITHVDYLSIDVEGYEKQVIDGIDFDSCDIYCLEVENEKDNGNPDYELRKYIQSKGYVFIGRLAIDDIYIKYGGAM